MEVNPSHAHQDGPTKGATRRSVELILLVWLVLQIGGLFSPGLLDDVDSVYIEIAREMLHRHDYVTPTIDGVRFFDKPPLMYWMAAGSMKVFGEVDWAARLPLALAVLGLLVAVYGLGRRFYGERGGFYAALVLGTAVGPYLYTRFFIPDIMIALWMTLGVWCFLLGVERAARAPERWPWGPSAGFGVVLGLNLLTKGLIGLVFPLGFCALYLVLTRQLGLLRRARVGFAGVAFVLVAAPWHVLAALRNPAIAMPSGLGLPARAGWAWFYLWNEHVARFMGKRIPHDYGNTPVWLFLLYTVVWVMPWAAFLPPAYTALKWELGHEHRVTVRQREAALTVSLWAGIVIVFFSISHRQEYYSLPGLPALALMVGGVLAAAERRSDGFFEKRVLACHRILLIPLGLVGAGVCGYFAVKAPRPGPGVDLSSLLASNPEMYNLSLGHLFDLTGAAMGLFRGPLALTAVGMLVLGPVAYGVRRRSGYAANLLIALGMLCVLQASHEALVRFNPILGSKGLAEAIVAEHPGAGDKVMIDGELTAGSTLLFYCRQTVDLVNGRVNGPWFGSFWPDSPAIFEDDTSLKKAWAGPGRVFLLTYSPVLRERELPGARVLASAGGKTVLVNR